MLTLRCAQRQLQVQMARHQANALLRALRRGPRPEPSDGTWRRSDRNNAQLPVSPIYASLRRVQRGLDRLDRLEEDGLTLPVDLAHNRLKLEREAQTLIDDARMAIRKVPEWPYVAGLYAVHVPGLHIQTETVRLEQLPLTLYRMVDLSDDHPVWPDLRSLLLRSPRGPGAASQSQPCPAFRPDTSPDGKRTLQRERSVSPRITDWLVNTATTLDMLVLAPGDYFTAPAPDKGALILPRVISGSDVY